MTAGPPFDPRMELPGVPDGWRVLWCAGCGYSVTGDDTAETDDWTAASPHDCPARLNGGFALDMTKPAAHNDPTREVAP